MLTIAQQVNMSVSVVFILVALALLVAYVASLIWVYRDAESRGRPALLVAILVALISWPVSLLVWIALRPNPSS